MWRCKYDRLTVCLAGVLGALLLIVGGWSGYKSLVENYVACVLSTKRLWNEYLELLTAVLYTFYELQALV